MKKYLISSFKNSVLASVLISGFVFSCKPKDDAPNPGLSIPSTYDTTNFAANTADEKVLLTNFANLIAESKRGRNIAYTVELSTIKGLYDNTPTFKIETYTSSAYKPVITSALDDIASSSAKNYVPSATIPATGGVYGAYLFNKYGLEPDAMLFNGLLQALLYNRVLTIMSQPLTEASIDKILVLWGATPQFANQGTASKTAFPDINTAKYTANRDKNEPSNPGYYLQIKASLLKAKAAIKAGSQFNNERDVALSNIKLSWEKSIAATMIYYSKTSASKLNISGTITDANYASAMHAMSEAVGFINGFKGIADKRITDSQIETILTLLYAPSVGPVEFYKYKTNTDAALINIELVIDNLKTIYGFTEAEIVDFATNFTSSRN